jgi:hypothetical protein
MSAFPQQVLATAVVKAMRDLVAEGQPLTSVALLDLIGSHEQLRAIALVKSERLRQTEHERDRLQRKIEELAEKKR